MIMRTEIEDFPPPPSESIDWESLNLINGTSTYGHVESRFSTKTKGWTEPELVKNPELKINGLSPALNYGQQCYEGMKAYRTPSGSIQIFRPTDHAARMRHSAEYVSLPQVPIDHFLTCINLAVCANAALVPPHSSPHSLYIRPILFSPFAHLPLSPPTDYLFCVYVQAIPLFHTSQPQDALVLDDFDRAAARGTGSAKIGGNYAPVMRWSGAAATKNYTITLHLDSQTRNEIEEFSSSGFIGVLKERVLVGKDEKIRYKIVVPDSENIIQSITSASCLAIAKGWGWEVERRAIRWDELRYFSEVLAVGTAAAVVPIRSISRKSTDEKIVYLDEDDGPGPVCHMLRDELTGIMKGTCKDEYAWCEEVIEVSGFESRDD